MMSSYMKIKKVVGDEEGCDFVGEEDEGEGEDLEGESAAEVKFLVKKKKVSLGEGSGKRGCGGGGGSGEVAPPCCLVENCEADLSGCKKYHQRHRVCEVHAKAPVALVEGLRQRFCQQCSRDRSCEKELPDMLQAKMLSKFHELSEFDQTKRSCRRRLAGHNERRRKSSLESQKDGSSRQLKENQFRQLKERTEFGSPGNQNYHVH